MKHFTNDTGLSKIEYSIKKLIISEKHFSDIFNFIYKHYLIDYSMKKSNIFLVLKAIYIENINMPAWKIADYCYISRTSLFDYRHEIIDCFYTCLNQNIIFEEIALTGYKL